MIPAGYMAKRVARPDGWVSAPGVESIYSISNCDSSDFTDYIQYWKHNAFSFFDSPETLREVAREASVDLKACQLFYYEIFEDEFDESEMRWKPFEPWEPIETRVLPPIAARLEGFDVVTFSVRSGPECSPLFCNNLAGTIPVNRHCLIESLDEAKTLLQQGAFNNSEPGPFRVFGVYSLGDMPALD